MDHTGRSRRTGQVRDEKALGARGRGTPLNPPNRFEKLHLEPFSPGDEGYDDTIESRGPVPTTFLRDTSRSILSKNDSPDVPFTYSVNPYRGCEHGCAYCYARPSHEYLGFSAGLDFETKILVKEEAPALLRAELSKPSWKPQMVALSGNTDPYQPAERRLRLSRGCLEVFLEVRNPVGIITKNALVLRDADLLRELASMDLVSVALSVTSLDETLTRRLEPRTSTPARKLAAIEELSAAGIPVSVMVAPVIPGLTDHEIPAILREAAARGARSAGCIVMRLPGPVAPMFMDWVKREVPDAAGKIESRIRDVRGGNLSDPRWGSRMSGEGESAAAIRALFRVTAAKYGLNRERFEFDVSRFRRPPAAQGELFP